MHFQTTTKFKTCILFLTIANLTFANMPLGSATALTDDANSSSLLSNTYTTVTANLNNVVSYPYFKHLVAGSIIALGGAYYWYQKYLEEIDEEPNYDPAYRCEMPGMIGACPPEIRPILERLNESAWVDLEELSDDEEREDADNVMLLEGPTGIGKTSLARAIAKNTDSHLVEIYGSDVMSGYIGGTAQNVNDAIEDAIRKGNNWEERIIIFFDEIDAFAVTGADSLSRTEYDAAYKALWHHIDNNKCNPNVFFIFATNHMDRLPVELKNRVNHCIHMKNPDAQQRKELLNHFSKKVVKKELHEYCSADCIKKLIKGTKNFSVRNLSNLCKHAYSKALLKNEPISEKHLMKELETAKKEVVLQRKPNKDEQERREIRDMNKENLFWGRISGVSTILNILSRISFI